MLNIEKFEKFISQYPIYEYRLLDTEKIKVRDRVRTICKEECERYGTTWACPPAVGTVEACRTKCLGYRDCLMISTITEVADISNLPETLATRGEHERITNEVRDEMRALGAEPYVLSTEACTICPRCAYPDGQPCRFPDRMHPCVESQGINLIPLLEKFGLDFQYGQNVVTWVSLLFF